MGNRVEGESKKCPGWYMSTSQNLDIFGKWNLN